MLILTDPTPPPESVWFVQSWKCWHLWTAPNDGCDGDNDDEDDDVDDDDNNNRLYLNKIYI